jgi:hypothetical protein
LNSIHKVDNSGCPKIIGAQGIAMEICHQALQLRVFVAHLQQLAELLQS